MNYKILKRTSREITKNPVRLKFVSDHLKTIMMRMNLLVSFVLDLMLSVIDWNNVKLVKKKISKELMPSNMASVRHQTRWWDWYISEDDKKK